MPTNALSVLQAARDALADPRRFFEEELTGTGTKTVFRLGYTNIDPKDLTVVVAANTLRPNVSQGYEPVDLDEGYIRFANAPAEGAIITVSGFYWDWYSDTKLLRYIGYAATNYSTAEGADRLADLLEENGDLNVILGMAGAVEALWADWVASSREIDVSSPEVSIPVRQRFQQLSQMLPLVTQNLRDAEQALNIGRYKIEMFDLRRVSRTTNRLVPIFKEQEWDDFMIYPERILPPIDDGTVV